MLVPLESKMSKTAQAEQPEQPEHDSEIDRARHGVAINDRVQHIRDASWIGTVVRLDRNLGYPTTCGVIWDDDELKQVDGQWTNKLRVMSPAAEAVAA